MVNSVYFVLILLELIPMPITAEEAAERKKAAESGGRIGNNGGNASEATNTKVSVNNFMNQ